VTALDFNLSELSLAKISTDLAIVIGEVGQHLERTRKRVSIAPPTSNIPRAVEPRQSGLVCHQSTRPAPPRDRIIQIVSSGPISVLKRITGERPLRTVAQTGDASS
jgi:hypothetical protein